MYTHIDAKRPWLIRGESIAVILLKQRPKNDDEGEPKK